MEKESLIKYINSLSISNPLRGNMGSNYTDTFVNKIISLSNQDRHLDSKIVSLLSEGKEYSKFKYNQGVAELLLWFLCESQKLQYKVEVKVNGTKKNIDVQTVFKDKVFNFEVKSPEYPLKVEGQMTGRIANRSMSEDLRKVASNFEEMLSPYLSQGNFTSIKTYTPMDNKLKDCLLSAHNKFNLNNESSSNILFVCTTTEELIYYLQYLMNDDSGLFMPNSFCNPNLFNKVQVVILSNAITLNERENENSWDLSKSINLILHNPNCEYQNFEILKFLLTWFPNQTNEFAKGMQEFNIKQCYSADPLPTLSYFIDYVAQKGFSLKDEENKRKL